MGGEFSRRVPSRKLEHSVSATSRTQGSRGKVGLVPLTQGSGYTVSKVMTEATFTRSQQRKDNEGLFLSPLSFPCRPPACPGLFPGLSLLCGLEMAPWPPILSYLVESTLSKHSFSLPGWHVFCHTQEHTGYLPFVGSSTHLPMAGHPYLE